MNDKIRNYLGYALIVGVLLTAFSVLGYVRTYSKMVEPGSYRSFTVSAEGRASAVPDVATFTFSVVTEGGKDLAELQKQNSNRSNQAIAYLKGEGVVDADIRTENYNIEPRYQYSNCRFVTASQVCPPPEIIGYTIRQSVAVKVRDFSKTGSLLSGVVNQGANTVSQLSFTVDDPTMVENQARAEAVAKAKEKAKVIAEFGDFRLGRLISISENDFGPIPYYERSMLTPGYGGDAKLAAEPPSIEPGSNEVVIGVSLHFEIK